MMNRAFKSMIVSRMEPVEGAKYIMELFNQEGEIVWELMEEFYGKNWKCAPEHLPALCLAIYYSIKKQVEDEKNDI